MNKTELEYLREITIKRKTYFLVKKNEQIGLLTAEHKVQIPIEWDELEINKHFSLKDFLHIPAFYSMYNERNEQVVVIFVKRKKKWGLIDLHGQEIIPVFYDKVEIVSYACKFYFKVATNGREGLVCLNENVLIPVKWEKILPASFSTQESEPRFCWDWKSDCLFCFVSYRGMESAIDPLVQREKERFQFVIYDRYFELVTPEVLDGYATITASYRLARPFNSLVYILIRKQNCYGVLSEDVRLINKPVLTYEDAIDLIRRQQQEDYINIMIDHIKNYCKKINKYFKQNKIAAKTEVLSTQNIKGAGLPRENNMITKDEIKKITVVMADMLTDLKAFKLAGWAKGMELLIEKENHQEILSIIGDLLEWLQALRLDPELTIENRPVIEKENDQDLQPVYNQGFAEAI